MRGLNQFRPLTFTLLLVLNTSVADNTAPMKSRARSEKIVEVKGSGARVVNFTAAGGQIRRRAKCEKTLTQGHFTSIYLKSLQAIREGKIPQRAMTGRHLQMIGIFSKWKKGKRARALAAEISKTIIDMELTNIKFKKGHISMYNGIYNNDVNRLYESVVWTHKIQRTYLESLEKKRKVLSIFEIVFTAASSVSTAVCALLGNSIGTIVSSIIVLIGLVLTSILEKVETKSDMDSFRRSSSFLWLLRCKVEKLSHEIQGNMLSDEEVSRNVELLQAAFDNATSNLPTIPNRITEIASHKIKDRKDEEVEMKLL